MTKPEEVLTFWLDEVGEKGWYEGGEALDTLCRERFGAAVAAAQGGGYRDWLSRPTSALAYMILTDQLPRNIHRGTALAFATDALALSGAAISLSRGHDRKVGEPERQFFYMPFEHAETRQAQALSVSLFHTRTSGSGPDKLLHARAHREIIRRFGRFPFRNTALGRKTSGAEQSFLDGGAYRSIVEALQA